MEKKEETLMVNMCYKVIYWAEGLLLLFEDFTPCEASDIKINCFNGLLYIEIGFNVFLLTDRMMGYLAKKPKIAISVGKANEYEIAEILDEITVDKEILSQLKGALSVLRYQQQNQS